MTFAEQLARLRAAAADGRVPADLATWALRQLMALAPAAERSALRDELLRQAASLLPGSTWARARQLRAELLGLARRQRVVGEVRELLADVLELDPNTPRSVRQLFRVLRGADMDPPGDVSSAGAKLGA